MRPGKSPGAALRCGQASRQPSPTDDNIRARNPGYRTAGGSIIARPRQICESTANRFYHSDNFKKPIQSVFSLLIGPIFKGRLWWISLLEIGHVKHIDAHFCQCSRPIHS
jgi:hypothetical protein